MLTPSWSAVPTNSNITQGFGNRKDDVKWPECSTTVITLPWRAVSIEAKRKTSLVKWTTSEHPSQRRVPSFCSTFGCAPTGTVRVDRSQVVETLGSHEFGERFGSRLDIVGPFSTRSTPWLIYFRYFTAELAGRNIWRPFDRPEYGLRTERPRSAAMTQLRPRAHCNTMLRRPAKNPSSFVLPGATYVYILFVPICSTHTRTSGWLSRHYCSNLELSDESSVWWKWLEVYFWCFMVLNYLSRSVAMLPEFLSSTDSANTLQSAGGLQVRSTWRIIVSKKYFLHYRVPKFLSRFILR